MSSHTKGPWRISFGGQASDDYAVIGSPFRERAVCTLEPNDYTQENALLISCAPEMLESLESIINQAERGFGISLSPDLDDAIRVIRKAKGEDL